MTSGPTELSVLVIRDGRESVTAVEVEPFRGWNQAEAPHRKLSMRPYGLTDPVPFSAYDAMVVLVRSGDKMSGQTRAVIDAFDQGGRPFFVYASFSRANMRTRFPEFLSWVADNLSLVAA